MDDLSGEIAIVLLFAGPLLEPWLRRRFDTNWWRLALLVGPALLISPWIQLPVSRDISWYFKAGFLMIGCALLVIRWPAILRQLRESARD